MKYVCLLGLLCVFLAPSAMAADPGPRYDHTIIFDIPRAELMAQYGRLPGTALLAEAEEETCQDWRTHEGDTLKMLVILLEFDKRPSTYSPETMDSLFFSRDYWPTGSVAEYFEEVSYGKLTLIGNCQGWFYAGKMPNTWPDAWFDSVLISLDPYIDYSQYDGEQNGFVDAICFVYSGNSQLDSDVTKDPGAFAWMYTPEYALGPLDGVLLNKFHAGPETRPIRDPDDPNEFTGEDTVTAIVHECHELSHNLSLLDLYDFDYGEESFFTPDDTDDHPMVDWCIMDGSQEHKAFEITDPAHLCGWSKTSLGWLDAITLDGEYQDLVIYNIETHPDSALYQIQIREEEGEYFLLEYRNPLSTHQFGKYTTDFSAYFYPALDYGSELFDRGLLITHVDESYSGTRRQFCEISNLGYPYYDHYAVAVVDAGYDPNRDYTYNPGGDVYDGAQWWYPYETRLGACFSSDVPGQSEFGPNTSPSSDGYYGPTGIYVRIDSLVGDRLYMYVNTAGGGPTYVCGDVDGDGEVTTDDLKYLIDYLHKDGPPPDPMEAADVNGDGVVNQLDANYLNEYLRHDGPEPTCP